MPAANLVGTENGGWPIITSQLTHERVALAAFGGLAYRLWDEVRDWAAGTVEAGRRAPPRSGAGCAMSWR